MGINSFHGGGEEDSGVPGERGEGGRSSRDLEEGPSNASRAPGVGGLGCQL